MPIQENLSCKRDDLTIKGTITYPDGFDETGKYPCVIISHGFTGKFADVYGWCNDFAGIGYIAVCFGFCGGGSDFHKPEEISEGASTQMTISTEVKDLLTVFEHVTARSYIDKEKVILMGESQGGFVSGIAAARLGDKIARLIMVYPALCIPDHARRGILAGASYDVDTVPDTIKSVVTTLGSGIPEDVVGMDPYLEIEGYKGPVLIFQGMVDDVVNYSYAIRAKEAYAKDQAHLQLIEEMGHGMDPGKHESAFGSIRMFLADKKEVLTIHVIITEVKDIEGEGDDRREVYFTGYCDTPVYSGAILPGACDTQRKQPDGSVSCCADYTLDGKDADGNRASIHIVNKNGGADWKPTIKTDSKALKWLEDKDLTAILEHSSKGPVVRIYA